MKRTLTFLLSAAAICMNANAQNPIITGMFAPDPAPYVHDGKVYLFVDHDEPDATFYYMKDWHVFSTEDMVNWTHLGAQVTTANFEWAVQGDNAWASQAVEVGGKWYWYLSIIEKESRAQTIAVAVADNPMGPWKDAIGGPLAKGEGSFIDPTVFIDDDGRAYLFWGNKGCWYGELNPDMISFKDGFKEVPGFHDPECFGPAVMKMNWSKGEMEMMVGYEEGPWVCKRNGIYYMSYPSGGVPEHMAYSTAPTINGPWKYGGKIMDVAPNSFTIHGGNINFKGHDYMFYHSGMLQNGNSYRRSACVEEFSFNPDGSIPFIPATEHGVSPVGTLNPYRRVEAETMAQSYGVKNDRLAGSRHYITSIHTGDWICVREVDFGNEKPVQLTAEVLNVKNPGRAEFYLDTLYIQEKRVRPIATVNVEKGSSVISTQVRGEVSGKHNVYILFRGGDEELFDFDWWQFSTQEQNADSGKQEARKLPEYPKPDLVINLWPDGAPTSNGITAEEFDYGNHVTNVTKPTLSVFLPDGPCNGLAILSCPGGAYVDVWDKTEGFSLADWYNEMGIVYAVLKYRLPNGHKEVPLDDVQEAMRILRSRADEFGFSKLGVQGNSAGGHLAAMTSTHYTNAVNRPDFTVLFYPVVTLDPSYTHMGTLNNLLGKKPSKKLIAQFSNEKCVTPDTPPAFLMHSTNDDAVPVRNSVEYYNALVRNGVKNSAMYIMPVGGHGWTDHEFEYRSAWMEALKCWLLNLTEALK